MKWGIVVFHVSLRVTIASEILLTFSSVHPYNINKGPDTRSDMLNIDDSHKMCMPSYVVICYMILTLFIALNYSTIFLETEYVHYVGLLSLVQILDF